jgi:hypothetical protein
MYRNGRPIDPASVAFVTRAALSGPELASFRSALATLKTIPTGAALADLAPSRGDHESKPQREIDKLD